MSVLILSDTCASTRSPSNAGFGNDAGPLAAAVDVLQVELGPGGLEVLTFERVVAGVLKREAEIERAAPGRQGAFREHRPVAAARGREVAQRRVALEHETAGRGPQRERGERRQQGAVELIRHQVDVVRSVGRKCASWLGNPACSAATASPCGAAGPGADRPV